MRERLNRSSLPLFAGAVALLGCSSATLPAQQPPAAPPAAAAPAPRPGPEVGSLAPDFSLPAATRYGLMAEPFRLSQFRGQAVVLAFFTRARTRG
jgi:energy-converting hydrogenase Eha subunit H